MSISRRGFLQSSAVAAASVPFLRPLNVDTCGPTAQQGIDYSMGFPPDAIRLNRNENPLGPSPRAVEAACEGVRVSSRYADSILLRPMLADHLSIDEDWVLVGTGSGEILKLAPLVYVRNGGNIVSTLESYRSTPDFATALGADIKWVRLREDGSYDVEGLLNAVDSNTKLFYLVQPNNPTGTLLDYSGLVKIADALPRDVLFLIDEAYIHFCPEGRTGLDLLKAGYENVLVTRTFSKAYALAGLRCGYGMGHPEIMRKLAAFGCGPTSTNMAGYGAAAASLQDDTHVLRSREYVQRSRAYFEDQFRQMGLNYLSGPPTFILVEVGERAGAIRQALLDRKIYVRSGDEWELPRHLRISYGLEAEHRAFFAAFSDLLG